MTVASVSRTSTSTSKYGLPPTLRTAQSFLPVGWLWRGGAPTVAAACEMAEAEGSEDEAEQAVKHKMPEDG